MPRGTPIPIKTVKQIIDMKKRGHSTYAISDFTGIAQSTIAHVIARNDDLKSTQTAASSVYDGRKNEQAEKALQSIIKKMKKEKNKADKEMEQQHKEQVYCVEDNASDFNKFMKEYKQREEKINVVLSWLQKKYVAALIIVSLLAIFAVNWFGMTFLHWAH